MLVAYLPRFTCRRSYCVEAGLIVCVVCVGLFPTGTLGQQVLVDDPTSVEPGAAQLEAWHGPEESSISPAVRVLPALEVAVGTAFLRSGATGRRRVEHNIEGKLLLRPGSVHRLGAGVVAGARARQLGVPQGRPRSVFAYGILSQDLFSRRLTTYQNVGWAQEKQGPHRLMWGARVDWTLLEPFTLIGEISGEGRNDPSVQLSIRTVLLPDRVETDLSITRAGPFNDRRTWLTVGFTFMSSRLYGSE